MDTFLQICFVIFGMACCIYCFIVYLGCRRLLNSADEVLDNAYKAISEIGDDLENVRESVLRVKQSMDILEETVSEKSD